MLCKSDEFQNSHDKFKEKTCCHGKILLINCKVRKSSYEVISRIWHWKIYTYIYIYTLWKDKHYNIRGCWHYIWFPTFTFSLCPSIFSNFLPLATHYIGKEKKTNHKCCSLQLLHLQDFLYLVFNSWLLQKSPSKDMHQT